MRYLKRLALPILSLFTLVAAGLGLSASPAHATYTFPWGGITMIDTENPSCNVNDTNPNTWDCYTWIRSNGTVRRGSPAEYFSEASGGFVWIACSQGLAHTAPAPDIYAQDFWGNTVNKHFHWSAIAWVPGSVEYNSCHNPVAGGGATPWTGTPWSMIPNGSPL